MNISRDQGIAMLFLVMTCLTFVFDLSNYSTASMAFFCGYYYCRGRLRDVGAAEAAPDAR